MTDVSPNL